MFYLSLMIITKRLSEKGIKAYHYQKRKEDTAGEENRDEKATRKKENIFKKQFFSMTILSPPL